MPGIKDFWSTGTRVGCGAFVARPRMQCRHQGWNGQCVKLCLSTSSGDGYCSCFGICGSIPDDVCTSVSSVSSSTPMVTSTWFDSGTGAGELLPRACESYTSYPWSLSTRVLCDEIAAIPWCWTDWVSILGLTGFLSEGFCPASKKEMAPTLEVYTCRCFPLSK